MCTPIHTWSLAGFQVAYVVAALGLARRAHRLGVSLELSLCQDLRTLKRSLQALRCLLLAYLPIFILAVQLAPTHLCELSANTVVSPANAVVWMGWILFGLFVYVLCRLQGVLHNVRTEMIHRQLGDMSTREEDDDYNWGQQESSINSIGEGHDEEVPTRIYESAGPQQEMV